MQIRILGSGCGNCATLTERTRDAVAALGLDATVVEEHDPAEIAACNVMRTPALEIDGEIVVAGRVPTVPALVELLGRQAA
jgi:small redox-active disulfide protein 2